MKKDKITIEKLNGNKQKPLPIMDNEDLGKMISVNRNQMKLLNTDPTSYWRFYEFLNGVNPKKFKLKKKK